MLYTHYEQQVTILIIQCLAAILLYQLFLRVIIETSARLFAKLSSAHHLSQKR